MTSMRLKLNPEKTEFIIFGYRDQLKKCETSHINTRTEISHSNIVKYLGANLDESLSFNNHITQKCRKAMYNLVRIRSIRKYLTRSACETIIMELVISHLDYVNSLMVGLPLKTIQKLERVQYMAAKIILNKKKYSSTTEAFYELHWIPIKQRIKFKILTIVHKCVYGQAPTYLKNLITKLPVKHNLRSSQDTSSTYQMQDFCGQIIQRLWTHYVEWTTNDNKKY